MRPHVERAQRLQGWILEVEPVPLGPPPPWDYAARARELVRGATALLDLGTGGGERLSEISRGYHGLAVATEEWDANAPVAAARLAAIGTHVVRASALALPFAAGAFDLVLDRHEALEPAEIGRVLRPGGTLLTQQVISEYWSELRRFFPRMTDFGPHYQRYQTDLRAAGLIIRRAAWHSLPVAYRDLGEIVYLLTAAPWTVPDFDLERDLEALLDMEKELRQPDGIVLTEGYYLIEALKPN